MSEIDIKTCTVTVYRGNYGAFLQAWALQQFLGEQNFLLRIEKRLDLNLYVGAKGKKRLPFFWRFIAFLRYLFRKKKPFDELNMLKCSRRYYSQKDITENPPVADAYIAGSDQIWNNELMFVNYKLPWKIHFLEFGIPNAKRIAYAASMGAKEWPVAFTQKVLPYLKKFHAISVREESSVPFLNSIGLKNVVVTCDPTILHTADFYRSNFHYAEDKCSDCIFIYSLGIKFSLSMQLFLGGKNMVLFDPNKSYEFISIAQWLYNIEMAEGVVTNSFHGTVFSILFHKPFLTLPIFFTEHPRNERLTSLLKKVKLEYRLLNGDETEEEIKEILYRPVDWEQVDRILEEWRTYSANWLKDALASKNVQ